jgi:hypothetical protein
MSDIEYFAKLNELWSDRRLSVPDHWIFHPIFKPRNILLKMVLTALAGEFVED